MQDAAKEFGPGTPYGSTLMEVGDCERRLGAAEREFFQTSAISFLTPLRNFLEGDWRTISKERRLLENLRLDLDACKTRVKKAKVAEAKAATAPDFQETRPRNYVLSASASALWSEEVEKAEHELRVAQTEFDRQAEVTRLLLEGISSTHFVEAQAAYYKQCHFHMQELQKELARLPNAFALNSTNSIATAGSASEGISRPGETDTLKIEEVQAPATGTRKAKVLYDYDAADSSELSLLADELSMEFVFRRQRLLRQQLSTEEHLGFFFCNNVMEGHILIVIIRDNEHLVGESQLLITGTLEAILALIGDLQEDSVEALPGNYKVPTGVVETSMTEGISSFTLPFKIFPIKAVVTRH
ncbi:hypothetical protein FQN60_018285 [Etheostoma spectabile]|uniref:BAR domain-containing protein n=1 Tax=Etheostoma spectabile TaxID=54343 RepID=A0A5J5DHX9_9PERO|nr:hypothetical protein FQN60_018285 [Etheostoma spectabile]